MISLVLALNLESKISSKLTFIFDSDHSDSLPLLLYGAGVFDNLRKLSEESMAPREIWDINKTYNSSKSVRVIAPLCIKFWKKGVPCVESATARSTRCPFPNIGKGNCSQANQDFPDNPRRLRRRIKKGGRFGLEGPVDEPPTSDATSGHSKLTGSRMGGVQQWTNTSSSWKNTAGPFHPQGNPIGVAPEVPILVTRKD
ncbi:hypothetical protein O181_003948 [Austropuccinia psidii MF-1]|uniref:Uncharacterized protein n=1 Tax=Austropuccinia psidii MF-1 TaxID=1389203 RepID=A0A9Q3BFM9_9BASI|nr:hypothetical protein [Austropuccinia psidii MF-1]